MSEEARFPLLDAVTRDDIPDLVGRALAEDLGGGDATAALIPEHRAGHARVISRDSAVICGQPWFEAVFARLDAAVRIDWRVAEGARVTPDTLLCALEGPARALLSGERCALNLLQTLSGTATAAATHVAAVTGTRARVLDTRKTLPGLRLAQKYAVRCGGGTNHRMGLHDAILIKENHILAAGGIAAAVGAGLEQAGGRRVEVEVESLAEAEEALRAGAGQLLLDNFALATLRDAVALRDRVAPAATLEASGGVDLDTLRAIAETGVDFVSVGAITKHLRAVDLSMRLTLERA